MSIIKLDPRIKFIVVFVLNTVLFSAQNQFVFIFNNVLIVLIFLFSKKVKEGLLVAILISLLVSLQYLSGFITDKSISLGLGLLCFLFTKFFVLIATGYWFTITTKVGNFISAMQNAKVPSGVIITLSVIFRFLPTVTQEFWYIKSTMKLRGVSFSFKNLLCHPIRTLEYALIPLMMRSMLIGNRLSASAMTRGLDLENTRTSYNEVKLKASDFLVGVVIISISISSIFVGAIL